jgi:hypothetical protein
VTIEKTGMVPVAGRVVAVFRGDGKLNSGDEVRFSAAVYRNPNEIPPGGWSWISKDAFSNAEYLEVFLNGEPPNCEVADYQVLVIDTPTQSPRAHVPTEDELAEQLAQWESKRRPS